MNADIPKLTRQVRVPRRLQHSEPHQFETRQQFFRSKLFEVVDVVVNRLKEHIDNKATPVLIAAERVLSAGWAGHTIPETDLDTVWEHLELMQTK